MISEIKSCERLLEPLDDNATLRAIPNERGTTAWRVARVQKMEETLSKTFARWPFTENNNNNNFRVSNIRVSNRTLIYNVCPEAALT